MDKGQAMRYSEAEKDLIKRTFQDDVVLFALRNLFWQLDLTELEKKVLNFKPDQLALIKKVMIPDIEREIPLNQQVDETVDPLLEQLHMMNPALAVIMMDANDLRIQYLRQQYDILESKHFSDTPLVLKDLKKKIGVDDEHRHINMLAYKSIRGYIDGRINEFKHFANPPEELTPEQQKEKAKKDSSR